ncbi:carbohydrate kinase family protein [Halorubrum sp. SD626R]|uniref:carbohydrate kinase family protein n=1 Tax=Halorubrum sp. SD626R TaxID=1419722 RepID=UPI000AD1A0DA|nr:PfkB family carbohydrate kinase [Halorubrum sp. SD626R]TKX81011.1 carbohydrate kinase family protein [Halorubrum sp. SD626R]
MSEPPDGTLVVGDTTIDLYPVGGGPTEPGGRFEWHVGGTATNVARWLAALDEGVTLVTNVGTDRVGELAARRLDAGPVGTDRVAAVDAASPLTLYVPAADGDRWDAWVEGSCYGFTPPDDPASLVDGHERVHLEGVTLPTAVNGADVRRLARAAAEGDARVSFDLNGRANQWRGPAAYRAALREVLPYCDLVFAGTDDLAVAGVEESPEGLAACLPADGSAVAFLTDGASPTIGFRVGDGEITERVAVTPPSVAVATTAGAGDAFAAAVLAARGDGVADLRELAEIGNAAGAAAATTVGSFEADAAETMASLLDGD